MVLEPPTENDVYAQPAYAHSHLAFFKGVGYISLNKFDKVEVWATKYNEDLRGLAPLKVDDYPVASMTYLMAGHGRAAAASTKDAPIYGELYVWNLATGARQTVKIPGDRKQQTRFGLTKTHLYIAGSPPGTIFSDAVFRFELRD